MKFKAILIAALISFIFAALFVGCEKADKTEETDGAERTESVDSQNVRISDNEKKLISDLKTFDCPELTEEGGEIVSLKVEDRKKDMDERSEKILCTVRVEDGRRAFEKKVTLTYDLSEKNGRRLVDVSVNDRSEWITAPLVGVSVDEITETLRNINIIVDGENWDLVNNSIKVAVDEQKTDLASGTDAVGVTVAVDDVTVTAVGGLQLIYSFDKSDGWIIDSVSGSDSFTAEVKPGMEINITDEMMSDVLSGQIFEYGAGETQKITVRKEGISDLTVKGRDTRDRGRHVIFYCSFVLTEPHAEFDVEAEIHYLYDGGWKPSFELPDNDLPVSFSAECTSVKLDGLWTGDFSYGRCELDIIGTDNDGNIKCTYSEYGSAVGGTVSYYLSGKIDKRILLITLSAGEMIEGAEYMADDINAYLKVDDSAIEGHAGLHQFNVTQ